MEGIQSILGSNGGFVFVFMLSALPSFIAVSLFIDVSVSLSVSLSVHLIEVFVGFPKLKELEESSFLFVLEVFFFVHLLLHLYLSFQQQCLFVHLIVVFCLTVFLAANIQQFLMMVVILYFSFYMKTQAWISSYVLSVCLFGYSWGCS